MDEQAYGSPETIALRRGKRGRGLRRTFSDLRVLGLLTLGSAASLATAGALLDSGRSTSLVRAFLAAALGLALFGTGAILLSWQSRASGPLTGAFVPAEETVAAGWVAFLAGCLIAMPVLSFFSRTLVGDSDSARLLASILHVQRQGFDYVIETQDVLLPHALLSPIVHLGGIPALQAFDVLSVIALAGVVAFLAWRVTGSSVGAVAATLALTALGPVLERAYLVPMYAAMLAFGFLGLYLAYRGMTAGGRARWWAAGGAATCLIVAMEAHQVGQLFVLLSGLLLVAVPSARAAAGLGRVYLCLAVLYIPRALINLSDGGFSHFFQNRVDYWVTKGYLLSIQVQLFDYPRDLSLGEYLGRLPRGLLDAWGTSGWATLALGAIGLLVAPAGLRRFIIACTLFVLAVVIHLRLPLFSRYLSLLLVGSALAAGVTVAACVRRREVPSRALACAAIVGLLAANVASYHTQLDRFQTLTAGVLEGPRAPYRELAKAIKPGDGVVGTRSLYLNITSTNPSVYGDQFLSEAEYRTFLTWPSDAEVIALMRRHDVQWVLVPRGKARWVTRYNNIWLSPAYGEEARYPRRVARSPNFCLAERVDGASLYRLAPGSRAAGSHRPHRCLE